MKHLVRRGALFFISVILGLVIACITCNKMVSEVWIIDFSNMIDISKVMIGVWGTLLGFIITAESILVAFSNGTVTGEFKKTKHYMTVIFQYTQTSIKLLIYIFSFIWIIVTSKFAMKEMFTFVFFSTMTFIDILVCVLILILMLRMANT